MPRDAHPSARNSLRRSLALYALILAVDLAILYWFASYGISGFGYVTVSIVGVIGMLLTYQVLMHILDLGAQLNETEGEIVRKWTRADLIIAWHSYYLTVDRSVFRVSPHDYIMVDEGMTVKIAHFPRTMTVVSVEETRRTPPLPPPAAPSSPGEA